MVVFNVIYILVFIVFFLIAYAVFQIKLFGMNIKDFWSFIEANQILDKLYKFSKVYDKLDSRQQVIFLMEAEKVFNAFDKIPSELWEEEYDKYFEVLEKYRKIKVTRWAEN